MRRIFLTIVALLGLAGPAMADMLCLPRDAMVSSLARQFSEQRLGAGLTAGGGLLELFTSPDGGWTMLVTRPDGISCLISAGDAWAGYSQGDPA